jgi:hypothetical protein
MHSKNTSDTFIEIEFSDLSDEEKQLVDNAHKMLTEIGFDAVRICTLNSQECGAPLLNRILNGTEWEQELLIMALRADFVWLNDTEKQKTFAYQTLSPWVSEACIEEIFQNNGSSLDRANAFNNTLLPLVKKLSKLFLMGKLK